MILNKDEEWIVNSLVRVWFTLFIVFGKIINREIRGMKVVGIWVSLFKSILRRKGTTVLIGYGGSNESDSEISVTTKTENETKI